MPDISIPEITISEETKYDIILKVKMRKVSVIAFTRKKDACLKIKLVRNPKNKPILSETIPSIKNYATITKGVNHSNWTCYKWFTVLKSIIDTISFVTPSPNIQLKSLGC